MSNIFIARGYTDLTYATTLAGAVTSTATSFTIATPVPLPNLPFTAALDFNTSAVELVLVTAVNGTAWTVQRGWDTITPLPAVAHNAGSSVAVITSAVDLDAMNAHASERQTNPHSGQYLDAAGARHDLPSLHPAGSVIPTATPTVGLPFNQTGATGTGSYYARVDHVHTAESTATLLDGLASTAQMALWADVMPIPPGWLPCDGRDLDTAVYPEVVAQIGYSFGGAIGWYPTAPVIATTLTSVSGTAPVYGAGGYVTGTSGGSTVVVTAPSVSGLSIEAPAAARWYVKAPQSFLASGSSVNEPLTSLSLTWDLAAQPVNLPPLRWIIKVDRGAIWEPRPVPPAPVQISYYPLPPGSTDKAAPAGYYPSPYWWGFDLLTGLPVIYVPPASGNSTGATDVTPTPGATFPVLVYPAGTSQPPGTTPLVGGTIQ
jgi:hypothetical protein